MLNNLKKFLLLFLLWYLFSGVNTVESFILGFFSAAGVAFFSRRDLFLLNKQGANLQARDKSITQYLNLNSAKYLVWIIKEAFEASIEVIKLVYSKKISPVVEFVDTKITDDVSFTLYANSITMTPGTVSIETYNNKVLVHALTKTFMLSLKSGDVEKQIAKATA